MRILHVTDTHLGAIWPVGGAPRGWSRADDHADMLELALAPALREEVDAVVHSGDLFDRSEPPPTAITRARSLLGAAARRVPVLVVAGNHDRRGVRAALHGIAGLLVVDAPERVVLRRPGLALGVVPHARTAEGFAAAARQAVGGGVDLLVAHQSFHGVRVPGFTFRVGAVAETAGVEHLPPGVRQVACGHLHPRQIVALGEARIVCPGSTERTAFSEAAQTKGYAVWTAGASWAVAFHDLPARPMIAVRCPEEVDSVVPGAIVRVPARLEADVRARGGWTVVARAQLALPLGAA